MGTGKTSLGKALARHFFLPFVDIDEEIEKRMGMDIHRIFVEKGETFFRDIEEALIREYGQKEGMVISVGGGALQRETNLEALKEKGFLICLLASPKAILQRLKDDETRPLLKAENRLERIEELLRNRFPNYLKADAFLDTSYKSISRCLSYLTRFLYVLRGGETIRWEKPEDRWVLSVIGDEEVLRHLLNDPEVSVRLTSAVRLWKKGIPLLEELKAGKNIFLKWLREEMRRSG